MPKGRMLNRKISRSEKVAGLSVHAALLFSWTIPHLDSEGRIYADVKSLKGIVVPYLDYMTDEKIEECRQEIHNSGLATLYRNGRYFQFNGFFDNQRIDKTKEAVSEIPAPTPDELRSNSGATPGKVKLSKDNIKIKTQPYWAASSKETQEILKTVSKDFNIYQLLGKLKKLKGVEIPEEVIKRICVSYIRNKAGIKANWPWFIVTTQKEWEAWNAEQNVKESETRRAEARAPVAPAIAQILAGIKLGGQK